MLVQKLGLYCLWFFIVYGSFLWWCWDPSACLRRVHSVTQWIIWLCWICMIKSERSELDGLAAHVCSLTLQHPDHANRQQELSFPITQKNISFSFLIYQNNMKGATRTNMFVSRQGTAKNDAYNLQTFRTQAHPQPALMADPRITKPLKTLCLQKSLQSRSAAASLLTKSIGVHGGTVKFVVDLA